MGELVRVDEDLSVDSCVQARQHRLEPSIRLGETAVGTIATITTCSAGVSRTMSGRTAAMKYASTRKLMPVREASPEKA